MDFSSEVLIDFGLNLAGYLMAAILVYILIGRRLNGAAPALKPGKAASGPKADAQKGARSESAPDLTSAPEFVPLVNRRIAALETTAGSVAVPESNPVAAPRFMSRREERRAICREARRLLALGKSRGELMHRLPLTEDELEMLSAAG